MTRRLGRILGLGNLIGGVTAFFYFRFVDIRARGGSLDRGEIIYFIVTFALLGLVLLTVVGLWTRPLVRAARGPLPAAGTPPGELVRRRAFLLPYVIGGLSFLAWVGAGIAWAIIWALWTGRFTPEGALRSLFGNIAIGGTITAAFIFLATEQAWRRELPYYFPAGDLSATEGVPRVRVRTRLLVIFLLISIVPLSLLGVMGYTRAAALVGADPHASASLLQGMLLFILFIVAVGSLVAVGLALVVSRSVAAPLQNLEAAMGQVAQGNLAVRCPVVTNDELGAVSEGFNRMVEGLREREFIRETFGKYVAREIRDEILGGRVALDGQVQEVTILFSDLRDFTPWVEAHDPREVVRDLNAYFTLMDGAIRGQRGLVLQFIGDEIEAVFGAPIADPRHPELALAAALEMRRRLTAWNAERRAGGQPLLRHGIGIHTGPVLAGNIGSPDRLSYALVGDVVNLASRIQGLTKEVGVDILVSAATAQRIDGASALERLPALKVKGKSAEVEVYRVA